MAKLNRTVVTTRSGKLEGRHEDGLYIFRGIPYAKPPVGDLRWLPPEPVEPWQGVRPALEFGWTAPQQDSPSIIFRKFTPREPQSEDCLFLNIWTPQPDDSRRPVMVWIHGGAFSMGSGSGPMNRGDTLARRGNMVVVTINYRLGALGFLRLKEVTNGAIPSSGNEGLLDQIMALAWITENIASFGGDPENITVFGESAGAMSIGCLLAIPRAGGLFRKAILQSGASVVRYPAQAARISGRFLNKLGIQPGETDKLRSIRAEDLVNVSIPQQETGSRDAAPIFHGMAFQPVIDGDTLPGSPLTSMRRGSARGVAVLSGSNLEEAKLFGMPGKDWRRLEADGLLKRVSWLVSPECAPGLIEGYRRIRQERGLDVSPHQIQMAIQTDQQFRIPNIRVVEIQRDWGEGAFNYLFDWESAVPGLGACHALEVGFVFGNCDEAFHGAGPAAERLVNDMQEAWIAFARTGNPTCKGLGEWPAYASDRNTMLLGRNSHVEAAPYEEERQLWDNVPDELLS